MIELENLLAKLREIGFKAAKRYEDEEDVIGTALAGSLGRGDIWEGSDVDIYVVREGDEIEVRGEAWKTNDFLVNVHHVSRMMLERLNDLDFFAESQIPDELYGCRVIYDPEKVLLTAKAFIEKNRFSDEAITRKIGFYRNKTREDLASASIALSEDDLPTAMFYCWIVPIPHILFIHFRRLIRSVSRFPELFTQLSIEENVDWQLREYYGPEVDVKELETASSYFVEAWEEVGNIFRDFSSSQLMEKLSPSRAEWVKTRCNLNPQLLGEKTFGLMVKDYRMHLKHGYLRGALGHMRANVTQDLVSIMNYLYEGVFKTSPPCKEPFSPFKLLRANEFITRRLYEMILKANEAYNIETEEVGRFVEERTNAFEKVKAIIA